MPPSPFILIRVVDDPSIVTDLIDFAENGIWPHIEFGTPEGTWIGAHAGTGVQERPANYCSPKRERRYHIPCTEQQAAAILASVRQAIGTPYDYLDILGIAFHLPNLHSSHQLICSWFVYREPALQGLYLLNLEPQFGNRVTPDILHMSSAFLDRCVYAFPEPTEAA